MSYAEIKPEYYRMFQPDSPWHAGVPGWTEAPWPGWGRNPNLVGPPRLAVEGLGRRGSIGAYFKPAYEKPISGLGAYFKPAYERPISGLGHIRKVDTYRRAPMSGCGCAGGRAMGDADASAAAAAAASSAADTSADKTNGLLLVGIGVAVMIGGLLVFGPHRTAVY